MKLFTRFFLILFLFALTPVLITGSWFLRSNARVQENARQLHQQLVLLSSDAVETAVARLNRSLGFVQELDGMDGKDRAEYLRVIQRAAATYPEFSLLSVLDRSGREIVRIADTRLFPQETYTDRGGEPLVRQVTATGQIALSTVTLLNQSPLLTVVHPLRAGGCLYGVYNMEELWRRIRGLKAGSGGRILLLSAQGRPLPGFAADFPEPGWRGPAGLPDDSGWLSDIPTARGPMVGAYAKTPSLGWWTLSLEPRSEAFAVSDRFLFEVLSFLLLIMGATAFSAYAISGRLAHPLQKLVVAARRVSQGEFAQSVPEVGWGELNLLSKAFNDMTRQLKAYEDLQVERLVSEKAKVEALIHTIPDGIVLASFDGNVLYMNASARSLLGSSEKDTTMPPHGMTVREALREPKLRDMALALMRRTKKADNAEVELKSGSRSGIFLCRAVAVSVDKRDVGILLLLRDVTAERKLDRMKEEFFHSVVHDLRSPLGTIDGFVQLMKERGQLGDKEKIYLGYVQGSCERLRQLVTDILETAKIESGQVTLKPQPLDTAQVITRMRELYTLQAETRGIDLRFEHTPSEPDALHCDRDLIERVVMNLIGNAMKFTPKGGKITLSIAPAGRETQFTVADTGPGIPSDKLEFVFQKFKQLDKGIAVRSGYGLGLSICKMVVEQLHGGRIWAESEEGKGSRFIFRLPPRPPAQPKEAA